MNKVIEERTKRTEWYRDARFGMFIHWGLYAIPARGEWVRSMEQIPHEDYCHLTEEFTAENYNPREWARLAKKAGMKYAVLTAKHHDGFCLFDTKLTDYNSMNAGKRVPGGIPCRRNQSRSVFFYYRLAPPGFPTLWGYAPSNAQPSGMLQ